MTRVGQPRISAGRVVRSALLIIGIASFWNFLAGDVTFARSWYNAPEQRAYQLCARDIRAYGSGAHARGAIWITQPGRGYYTDDVVVSSGASSATVEIHGSVYGCRDSAWSNTYAVNVNAINTNAWRLGGYSSRSLYRGKGRGPMDYSSQGGAIRATLNVSGLATNNATSDARQTINLYLYRCFSLNGSSATGSCYPETIPVTVVRKRVPSTRLYAETRHSTGGPVNAGSTLGMYAGVHNYQGVPKTARVVYRHWLESNAGSESFGAGDRQLGYGDSSRSINWQGWRAINTYNYRVPSNNRYPKACTNTTIVSASAGAEIRRRSHTRCTNLATEVRLTPIISIAPSKSTYAMGDNVTLLSQISNASRLTAYTNASVRWWLDKDGNGSYGGGDQAIPDSTSRSDTTVGPTQKITYRQTQYTVDDGDAQQICGELVLNNVSGRQVNRYVPSNRAFACWPIAKTPSTSVSGGDLRTGGAAIGATFTVGGKQFGSWTEYAAYPRGLGYDVGTAGAWARPEARNAGVQPWDRLMFSNYRSTKGYFGILPATKQSIRNNFDSLPTQTIGSTVTLADLNGRAGVGVTKFVASGDLTISNGGAQLEKSVVVYARGNVTVQDDLRYRDSSYTNLADIPQLIIITDRNISIRDGVNNVDAWLDANGTISTCNQILGSGNYYDYLKRGVCNNKLTINGPVITNKIQLRRTYGAEGDNDRARGETAESINLRNDTYMWSYGQATSGANATIRTTYVNELPPRY